MNTPNPLALLNRIRPNSCPAEERWSLSIGDLDAQGTVLFRDIADRCMSRDIADT